MKRVLKGIFSVLLIFCIVFSFTAINTLAAGTVISFSKKTLKVGESLTVRVTINPGEPMYAVGCIVNYDSNVLTYKTGNATAGAGTLNIVESPQGETKVSYSLTFSAKAAGSCTISVADCFYSSIGTNGATDKGLAGASATVNVTDATLSSNANLSALSLSDGTLSPRFSPSKTSYSVTVKNSVTDCKIYATTADTAAKVSVSGSSELKIGKNVRNVTVIAPNGTQKVYTVTIYRSETDEEVKEPDQEKPVETNPLETTVDGTDVVIATDISSVKLFNGFTATTADYNGTQVAVAKDTNSNYTLYYLSTAGSNVLVPYTFDETTKEFKKLPYITQGENSYIFETVPADKTLPQAYYSTNASISGFDVSCYADSNSDMSDFYYVYCFVNGNYSFYRYDSRENVLQRYPELSLVNNDNSAEPIETEGFLARFESLTNNAKIIVIGLALVIIGVIALTILLIIKFIHRDDVPMYDENLITDEDFDNISINSFSLNTSQEQNSQLITDIEEENTEQEVNN